jgi:hypothetical protein
VGHVCGGCVWIGERSWDWLGLGKVIVFLRRNNFSVFGKESFWKIKTKLQLFRNKAREITDERHARAIVAGEGVGGDSSGAAQTG